MKISELKRKRFKIFVCGEIERTCNFEGVKKLLEKWSDYPRYSSKEKKSFWQRSSWLGVVYIDANITAQAK